MNVLKWLLILALTVPALAQDLTGSQPRPNSVVNTQRPTIRADFTNNINWARMVVDGVDVTGRGQTGNSYITWTPSYNLDPGRHTVQVQAQAVNGVPFNGNWGFTIVPGPTQDMSQPVVGEIQPKGTVWTSRPTISVAFPRGLYSAQVRIDQVDFSNQASITPYGVSVTPNYDLSAGTHRVWVSATGPFGSTSTDWTFQIAGGGGNNNGWQPWNGRVVQANNLQPVPGNNVWNPRPTISASFPGGVQPYSIQLIVDNQDFSAQAMRTSNFVSWTPSYNLSPGQHNITLTATDMMGRQVRSNWNFQLNY